MTDYTKLVEALRLCQFGECGCGKCYYKELKGDWCTEDNHPEFFDCDDKLKLDAADAIEALQAENADIREELFISQRKYDEFTTIASMQNAMLAKQLPKRGEWVREMNVYDEPFYHCSACGECFDSNRDDTYGIFNYCPNCGAKMEVQE